MKAISYRLGRVIGGIIYRRPHKKASNPRGNQESRASALYLRAGGDVDRPLYGELAGA